MGLEWNVVVCVLADRWCPHVRVKQEDEGQGTATLMLSVEGCPVAALGLRSYFGGHA
jgi:hypothetical protein